MRRLRPCARSLAAILALSPFAARVLAAQPRMREQVIGVRPDSIVPRSLTVSRTGRLAYAVRSAAGYAYVVDGVMGPTYTSVSLPPPPYAGTRPGLMFSPDGKRFAYGARKGDRAVVVVDGTEAPPFDSLLSYPIFSPDSRHLAFIVRRGGKARVVLDGVEGAPYDDASFVTGFTAFSRDSRHVYYTARRDGYEYAVIDGREVVEAERIAQFVYHDAGSRFACVVGSGGRWSVVADGKPGKPYREIAHPILFSQDGRRLMYIARDSLHHRVVVDGVESRGYDRVTTTGFSADGEHVAFLAADRGKWFWVLDGQAQKPYDRIDYAYRPQLSPDGTRLTYVATEGEPGRTVLRNGYPVDARPRFVVIGTWESERFDWALAPYFGPGGRVLYRAGRGDKSYVGVDSALMEFDQVDWAYLEERLVVVSARHGPSWHVVVDGARSEPYPEPVRQFAFSRDPSRLAYVAARAGKQFVVIGGTAGQPYDSVTYLRMSHDGRRVLYHAKRRGRWVVVAGGIESPEYDELVPAWFVFATPSAVPPDPVPESAVVIGRRGQIDIRLTMDWTRR